MDGFEVCRQLRARPETAEVPIMFLSSLEEVKDKARGFEAGANDYLSKPYSETALAAMLMQWLPQARAGTRIPLLDLAALHARYPGNPGLVSELEAVFLSTTEASLAALKRAIEQGDAGSCRKEAHALKGAAASVLASTIQAAPPASSLACRTVISPQRKPNWPHWKTSFAPTPDAALTHALRRVG